MNFILLCGKMFIGYVVWMVINLDSVLLMIILIFVIALILFLTTYLIIKKTKTNKIKKEIEKLDIERNLLVGVPILTELSKVKDLVKTDNLKEKLDLIKDQYDYIIIDCPPSLGLITLNAFTASNSVLIPVQCEYYALEGLGQLLNTIKLVKKHLNKNIEIEGALLTMFDTRTNLSKQVVDEVKGYFGDKVYKTVIPRNVKLSEAPSYGVPITIYDARSKGAKCYDKLGRELIKNNEEQKAKHMK